MKEVKKVFKLDETILIVTATTRGTSTGNYVSVTAHEIQPILKEDAVEQVREILEDGDLWRMAVDAQNTELGLSDWVDMVLSADKLNGFDNSLYPEELIIQNKSYLFDSRACGCLHDEIKKVTNIFNRLIKLHLSHDKSNIKEAEKLITAMKGDDIGREVEKFTRELVEIQ